MGNEVSNTEGSFFLLRLSLNVYRHFGSLAARSHCTTVSFVNYSYRGSSSLAVVFEVSRV